MKYTHHTLLPIGAFNSRGSVVGGRSMCLHSTASIRSESAAVRLAADKAAADKAAADKLAADKAAAAKKVADAAAAKKAADAKIAADKKAAADKLAADKAAADKVTATRVMDDKIAADKLAADKKATDAISITNTQRAQDITQAYKDILGREPDAGGLKYWTESGQDINTIRSNIQANENQEIAKLYKEILGREPDAEGLKYWADSGQDLSSIASNIRLGKESKDVFKPYNLEEFGGRGSNEQNAYYNAAQLANLQMERGRPDLAQQFINQANELKAHLSQPYRIDTFAGDEYGTGGGTVLVTPGGNVPVEQNDQGEYLTSLAGSGSDVAGAGTASSTGAAVKPQEIAKQEEAAKERPFGTGFGQALGYDYALKNSEGDLFQKYDAQGNLTEYLDRAGKWQKTSDVKPVGTKFNPNTGQLDTVYSYKSELYGENPEIVGQYVPGMSKYHEDQGGFLGEGGWSRIGGLVAAGLTAGVASGAFAGIGIGGAGLVPGSAAAIGTAVAKGALTSIALAGLQGASPQEMLKAGLTGAVSAGISSYLPTAGFSSFEQAALRVGTQTGLAAVTGGDVKNALISSIISSSLPTVMNEALPKDTLDALNKLPPEAQKVLMSTLNSTLMAGVQGGDISDAAIRGVTKGLTSVATDFAKGAFKNFTESDFAKSFSNSFGSSSTAGDFTGGYENIAPGITAPPTNVADYTDPEAFNAALIAAMQNPVAPGPASEGLASGPVTSDAGPVIPAQKIPSVYANEWLENYNQGIKNLIASGDLPEGTPAASLNDPDFQEFVQNMYSDSIAPPSSSGASTGTGGTGTGSIFDDLEDPGGVQDIINGSYGANTGLPAGLYRIGSGIQDLPNQGILSAAGTPLALTGDLKSVIDNIARGAEESGMTALVEDNGQLIANALYNAGLKGGVTPEQAQEIVSKFFSNPGDLNAYRMDVGRIANIDLTPPASPPPVAPPVTPPVTPPVISQPPIEEIEDVPVMPEPPKPPEPEKEKKKSKEKGGEGTKPADEPTPVVTPTPTAPTPTSDDAQKAADDAAAKKAADDAQKAADAAAAQKVADDQAAADRASQAAAAAKATADKAAAEAKAAADKSAAEAKAAADKAASDKAAADKATADKAAEAKAAAEKSAAEAKAAADKAAADKAASDKAASDKAASDKAAAEAKAAADKAAADKAASDKAMAEKAAADKAASDKAASDKAAADKAAADKAAADKVASDKAAADKAASDKAAADKVISDNQAATAKLISDLDAKVAANEKAGMTRDEATDKAVKDLAKNLGTTEQALKDSIAASQAGLEKNITGVKTDLTKLIAANEAAGLTRSEASDKAIKDLAASLGTTEQALKDSMAAGQASLEETIGGVKKDLTGDITNVKTDLTKLIEANEKAGMTRSDATDKAIKDLSGSLGTTEKALKDAIATSQTGIERNIEGVKTDLTKLITDNEAAGLTRSEASDKAIKDLAASLGTTEQALKDSISASQAGLESALGGVKTGLAKDIEGVKTDLTKLIEANESAGMTRSDATNKAIKDLAGNLGTTEQSLKDSIAASQTGLESLIGGVKTDLTGDIAGVKTDLTKLIEANESAGMTRSDATNKAIADLSASLGTTEQALKDSIAASQTGLETNIAGVKSDLTKLITDNEAAGLSRSEASDKAIKDLAASLGTTEQSLKDSITASQTGLESLIGGVKTGLETTIGGVKSDLETGLTGVKTDITNVKDTLQTQIAANESAGMSRDAATNKAVSDLAGKLGTTEQSLLDAIQGVATDLGGQLTGVQSNLTGQMGDLEGRLAAQIAANEAAGMGRDEAFSSAVAGLGTQIGGLGTQIGGIGQGLTGLQQGLAGLSAGFGAYQTANAQAAATKQRQEQGQQLLNMLTSQGKGEVKSAPLASIGYMYDVGGESIFATPKQESLFLSPFEDAPSPVEGAMPKYQYADGGFIEDDYTIDDLYRMLGS